MFSFVRVAGIIVSLHSTRNPNKERDRDFHLGSALLSGVTCLSALTKHTAMLSVALWRNPPGKELRDAISQQAPEELNFASSLGANTEGLFFPQ